MQTDETLVQQIREGDHSAFDELYRRYNRRLFSYILRLCEDRQLAEEIFQEVFLTVIRTDALELRERRFAGWLFTVARNRCLTHLREKERRARASPVPAPAPSSSPMPSPEEAAHARRQVGALSRSMDLLAVQQREVLLLKTVGGLTYSQIAGIQGVPEGTVKSRLHLAVKALRSLLGEEK